MSWVWPPPQNNSVGFSEHCVTSIALPLAAPPPYLVFTTSFPDALLLGWHKVIHKKRFPCSCQKRGGVCLTALHPGCWRIRCKLCYQFFLLFFICHEMFRKVFLLSSASGGLVVGQVSCLLCWLFCLVPFRLEIYVRLIPYQRDLGRLVFPLAGGGRVSLPWDTSRMQRMYLM